MRVQKGAMPKVNKVDLKRAYDRKELVIILVVWRIEKFLELLKI